MNDVQEILVELQGKGWTLAAIADEIGVQLNTVARWKRGERYPENVKVVKLALQRLLRKKRIPKRKRYKREARVQT